jgi:hypothetical protein
VQGTAQQRPVAERAKPEAASGMPEAAVASTVRVPEGTAGQEAVGQETAAGLGSRLPTAAEIPVGLGPQETPVAAVVPVVALVPAVASVLEIAAAPETAFEPVPAAAQGASLVLGWQRHRLGLVHPDSS